MKYETQEDIKYKFPLSHSFCLKVVLSLQQWQSSSRACPVNSKWIEIENRYHLKRVQHSNSAGLSDVQFSPFRMMNVWILTFNLRRIIFSVFQSKSFNGYLAQVLTTNPRVRLSDSSGIGAGLARRPVSLSQAGSRGRPKMASPRESQQLAITLTVCLHQSTGVCWPSNMMSLLISCIPLMGSRGEPCPLRRYFLSWCIVGCVCFLLGDQLDFFFSFFKSWTSFLVVFPPAYSSTLHSRLPFSLIMMLFALLCHSSSGWKQLHCGCILVMWVLVMIFTYLPRYTLNWMYRTFWSTLRFHEQILALCAQISALAFHLKEWCHCVDKLMISWWLLRENV